MKAGLDLKSLKLGSMLPIAASLLLLMAAWTAWGGWQLQAANRLQTDTAEARHAAAQSLRPLLKIFSDRARGVARDPALLAAIKASDKTAVDRIVKLAVPGTDLAEANAIDFTEAYAHPESFGFGKLGLMESALQHDGTVVAVVKDGGSARLAAAVPVKDGATPLAVVYIRQSLAPVLAAVRTAAPSGAYVALRQGNHNVVESGTTEDLRFRAEDKSEPIEDTGLRVVAAAPAVEAGRFGWAGKGEFAEAVLLALLAGACFWWSRRAAVASGSGKAAEKPADLTLAQMQSAGQIVSPEARKVVLTTAERQAAPGITLDRSIFRAYDIRGIVGQTLDANIARLIGQAIGTVMHERNQRSIVVARDGRLSSPSMAGALIEGLRKAGREVIDIGEVPTPVAYFGSFQLRTGSCVSVTGSHNQIGRASCRERVCCKV